MGMRYVRFGIDDFRDLMLKIGFVEVDLHGVWEHVFERQVETKSRKFPYIVRVYSSIDKSSGWTRPAATDAVKLELFYIQQGGDIRRITQAHRTIYRTKEALTRVEEKAREMFMQVRDDLCHDCGEAHGGIMLKRSGRNGPFLGCSRYPICRATRPAPNTSADPKVSAQRGRDHRRRYNERLHP